ncbi:ankyrin repeat domain-containing protein [Spiroplasma endosymbiont of Polydrusus pterygomalis]|uniref:ankyrin repeat domain-containing protein n=1 Tax=Spiroplasma endosymbiont of Polydrusus pterygomalis TaxID=3139327 RepID=UPI003CCAD0A4
MINNKKLIEAIISNDLEKIKSLISKDNINYQNNEGNTALHFATKYRNLDALSFLIANKANINIQNNEGNTALMNIVNNIHLLDTVKYLITHGAKINIENKDGNTALDLAAMYDVFYVVKHLLEKKANINFKNNALFLYAARIGDLEIIKAFLANGIDINTQDKDGNTTLHFATKNRRLKTVTFLLAHGININQQNKDGNTALHLATNYWNLNIVNVLIANSANINQQNKKNETAFMNIQKNINKDLFAPTHFCSEIDSILTTFSQFLNQQNKFGDSPLMTQIRYKNIAMINCLLTKDVNLNLQNEDNDTAFSLSLIFLLNKTALHQQFFNPEIAKITLNQQATKEIATFFIGKDGTNYKYIFTVKKEENDEYTFSKPVITKSKAITAKIFVVDFAINIIIIIMVFKKIAFLNYNH